MTRKQRRVRRQRVRRTGLALAIAAASIGLGALAVPAGANGSGGRFDQCNPGPNTVGSSASNGRNYGAGQSGGRAWNACD
jgi:hypothetical protein